MATTKNSPQWKVAVVDGNGNIIGTASTPIVTSGTVSPAVGTTINLGSNSSVTANIPVGTTIAQVTLVPSVTTVDTVTAVGTVNKNTNKTFSTTNVSFGQHSTNTTIQLLPVMASNRRRVVAMKVHATGAMSYTMQSVTGTTATSISSALGVTVNAPDDYPMTNPEAWWYQTDIGSGLQALVSTTAETIDFQIISYNSTT